jgi:plasmid stabilization system protein ParE
MQELAVLQERLERFPELGHELRAHDGHALRRIALGRVPYFIWYRFDPRSDVVRLVRLFHAHQNTTRLRLP